MKSRERSSDFDRKKCEGRGIVWKVRDKSGIACKSESGKESDEKL